MSVDIDISVVDAIRGREFHAQGGDVAGTITHKLDLVIQPAAFIHICARYSAAGCQQDYREEDYKCSFHGLMIDAIFHS